MGRLVPGRKTARHRPRREPAEPARVPHRENPLSDCGMAESCARVPDGTTVAFMEHPVRGDDGGTVAVVDVSGRKRTLSQRFSSEWGRLDAEGRGDLGDGRQSRSQSSPSRGLARGRGADGGARHAKPARAPRTLPPWPGAGGSRLDPHRDHGGRRGPGAGAIVRWLDWSSLFDLSLNGKMILFSETGEGSGPVYSTFIRTTDARLPYESEKGGGDLPPTGAGPPCSAAARRPI